jgi:hypothetical protein
MEFSLDLLTLERDGLIESIMTLEAYRNEVYKDAEADAKGINMTIDKLKDKLKLLMSQLTWLENKKSDGSKPSTTPR